ncbi:MAG: hypothetical protein ACOYK9_03660 [Chlamydiia bacterium]
MSWFQFKRPKYPLSRRHQLKAVLPSTGRVFDISHVGISSGTFQYVFPISLNRPSMVTQLELHRGQIRLSHKVDNKQSSYLMTPQGLYQGKELVAPLASSESSENTVVEQLDLGFHKTIDVDRNGRALNIEEIFPAWFHLGQIEGEGDLLSFEELNAFYFDGLEDLFASKTSMALQTGYRSIRSFFFKENNSTLEFLPALPPKIASGTIRLYPKDLTITFEWSKREVKRIVMHAHEDGEWNLVFPNKVTTMQRRKDYKCQNSIKVAAHTISLRKGEYLFLDQFRR